MTQPGRITHANDELNRSSLSGLLHAAYRVRALRRAVRKVVVRLEGDELVSSTIRDIFRTYHGVRVGAHSYGGCLVPGAFPSGVTVGRYVSVGPGVRVFRRNHPTDRLVMHPYFYLANLGVVERETIEANDLWIGHDAWIGADAIITPGCSEIGIGAVVGAGAVVTKSVPAFAIVCGNPARVIRMRFDAWTIERILDSRWWDKPIDELRELRDSLVQPLDDSTLAALGVGEPGEVTRCA